MNIEEYKKIPVEKIMSTGFISVKIDSSLNEILEKFHKQQDKSTAIAVYDGEKYIGLIEPLTLIKLLVDMKNLSNDAVLNTRGVDFAYFPKSAEDMVSRHQITLAGNETVSEAATIMIKRNLTRLAVMRDGKLAGIVKASGLFDQLKSV